MTVPFIGNERAVAAVDRAVVGSASQTGQYLAHAYLFAGPERVGKATLALRLAQGLNCEAESRPCGECSICRRIASGSFADVFTVTVEPTSEGAQRKAIGVEQLREVERTVSLAPYEGRSRCVIIDPADGMTVQAQNAFLKTLEEPPPHVVFVMVATEPDRLLETILSRCQRIDFRPVPAAAIEEALAERGMEPERARTLARLANGRPGWAFAMAEDESLLERRRETIEEGRSFGRISVADRMDAAEKLAARFRENREDVLSRVDLWESWQRDVLLVLTGAADAMANVDMREQVEADASASSQAEVLAFLRRLEQAREALQSNVNARLVLEDLLLRAPGPRSFVR